LKIEEINSKQLTETPNAELYNLHFRFIQLWNKNFSNNQKTVVGDLKRNDFLDKYKLLIKEIDKRGLNHNILDIDRALFKKNMLGIEVSSLGDIVVIPDYISIGGGFVKSPKEANDLDVILRDDERNRDEGMELKLSRLLQKQVKKDCHFVYNKTGCHSSYIPLFDLILRSKEETKRIEVKEDYNKSKDIKKSIRDYYEGLDNWNEDLLIDNYNVMKELDEGSVLDLGCGTGRLDLLLQKSGREVLGVENNDIAIKMCKEKNLKVEKLDLEKEKLPYKDNQFDNVIMIHSLEHIKNPTSIIKEAQRVANKKVIILCPLGERQDPTHQQNYPELKDFEVIFNELEN
jgi:hypothetical protein